MVLLRFVFTSNMELLDAYAHTVDPAFHNACYLWITDPADFDDLCTAYLPPFGMSADSVELYSSYTPDLTSQQRNPCHEWNGDLWGCRVGPNSYGFRDDGKASFTSKPLWMCWESLGSNASLSSCQKTFPGSLVPTVPYVRTFSCTRNGAAWQYQYCTHVALCLFIGQVINLYKEDHRLVIVIAPRQVRLCILCLIANAFIAGRSEHGFQSTIRSTIY